MASRRTIGQLTGVQHDPTRPAIVMDGVTERFRLYHQRPNGLKERLYRPRRSSYTDFHALEDVSFTIDHGESVAVIGHNGSGKSTLLKILARILPPDEGTAQTNGVVASLLELGAGFHGDLSGRENIYLNGAILGMRRAEIDARLDEIVEFAGIRPLLDTAVRTYSSGLYVRLGFAIAVTLDPDILLVDEVLAVGDAEFQERSLDRMRRFRDDGKTFVLVSHDLDAVREMCTRAIVLEHGRLVHDGDVDEAIDRYRRGVSRNVGGATPAARARGDLVVDDVELLDDTGAPVAEVATGAPLVVRIRLRALTAREVCSVGVTVARSDGMLLYELHSAWRGIGIGPLDRDETATVEVRMLTNLLAGTYLVGVVATGGDVGETLAVASDVLRFAVTRRPGTAGVADLTGSVAVTEGPVRRVLHGPHAIADDATRPRRDVGG